MTRCVSMSVSRNNSSMRMPYTVPDAPEMPMISRRGDLVFILRSLDDAARRVGGDAPPPALPVGLAAGDPTALCGVVSRAVPYLVPVAERIAVPRHLRPQRRQAETLPQGAGVLHVFAL